MSSRKSRGSTSTKNAITSPDVDSSSSDRTWAPLNTPFSRRLQTLTVLIWFLLPWLCLVVTFLLLRFSSNYILYPFLLYLGWMCIFQDYQRKGGLKLSFAMKNPLWRHFAAYFPVKLIKTSDLPPTKSYIFGYHPHGVISMGAFANFATDATDFSSSFPGINLRLLTLASNFRIPFYGFYLAIHGLCDASRESCNYILRKGEGNSIMLVLGGAKESLDARPGNYVLTLKNRKGFVKIALENGASLVPCFSFGENELFDQIDNPRGSKLRNFQNKMQARLGFALPFIKGRGVFQYKFGVLPHRRQIDTYVGEPIDLPKLKREEITQELIDQYHSEYMQKLTELFEKHKDKYEIAKDKTLVFVDDEASLK